MKKIIVLIAIAISFVCGTFLLVKKAYAEEEKLNVPVLPQVPGTYWYITEHIGTGIPLAVCFNQEPQVTDRTISGNNAFIYVLQDQRWRFLEYSESITTTRAFIYYYSGTSNMPNNVTFDYSGFSGVTFSVGNGIFLYEHLDASLGYGGNEYGPLYINLYDGILYSLVPNGSYEMIINSAVVNFVPGYGDTASSAFVYEVPSGYEFFVSVEAVSSGGRGNEYYFYVDNLGNNVVVNSVSVSAFTSAPYYPGTEVQYNAEVSGTGIVPGTPESSVYWYVHGNTSADTYIDNDGLLTIANDETSTALEVEAISTYDSTKTATLSVPVSYPLNLQITPAQTTLITSAKSQEIQFELLLPNGQPFDYSLLEWTTPGADGQYFRINDSGLLEILPGAPAGSVTVKYAYQHDTGNVSTTSAIVTITTQQEGIYDHLSPTPEQSDKADQMEDAIGDAADKLENNNSSLGQLTPTRPQINTDLQLDPDKLLAVSPLVTNIWSISGLQSLIGIVVLVATVAYIFFGKRDG